MPQEYRIQEAIRLAIESKKNLHDFYRQAAGRITNHSGQRVFERLADETRSNLGRFYHLYLGEDLPGFERFMATPPRTDSAMLHELGREIQPEIHDRKARELALREETDIERVLRLTAARVIDPLAREVLLRAADEVCQHMQVIESEYARTMGMVHETDIDTYVRE